MDQKKIIKIKKCENCFIKIGRYIFDCHCIICQDCLKCVGQLNGKKICKFCNKAVKGNFIDINNPSNIKAVQIMFGNTQTGILKIIQIMKFQNKVAKKYSLFLKERLNTYKRAIAKLVNINPSLQQYFQKTITIPTQQKITIQKNKQSQDTMKPSYKNYNNNQYYDRANSKNVKQRIHNYLQNQKSPHKIVWTNNKSIKGPTKNNHINYNPINYNSKYKYNNKNMYKGQENEF